MKVKGGTRAVHSTRYNTVTKVKGNKAVAKACMAFIHSSVSKWQEAYLGFPADFSSSSCQRAVQVILDDPRLFVVDSRCNWQAQCNSCFFVMESTLAGMDPDTGSLLRPAEADRERRDELLSFLDKRQFDELCQQGRTNSPILTITQGAFDAIFSCASKRKSKAHRRPSCKRLIGLVKLP